MLSNVDAIFDFKQNLPSSTSGGFILGFPQNKKPTRQELKRPQMGSIGSKLGHLVKVLVTHSNRKINNPAKTSPLNPI